MLRNYLPVRVTGMLVASAAVLAGPGSHSTASSCWHTVPGPAIPAGDSGGLSGVSMAGPSTGWAVGSTLPNGEGHFRPLLARWNGRRWQATRLPARVTTGNSRLDGIHALSPSNAWAVGSHNSAPLILHWNGHRWARVSAVPVRGDLFTALLGVAAASPSDAWAVGEAENPAGQLRTVTEHWNGRTWALVPSPSLGTLSALTSVAVSSNHQAWAVGSSFARTSRPLVLRWNGYTWHTAATPVASNVELSSLAAVSPSQVWAVGYAIPGPSGRRLPYALRWNGHAWRPVPVPAGPADASSQLGLVTVLPGGRLAAVGYYSASAKLGALYARWNRRRWSVRSGPLNGTNFGAITANGHSLWAVGDNLSATRFIPFAQTCRL